jgi:ribonuclease P protein component
LDYRLKKEKDFNLVFKKGSKLYSPYITLLYKKAPEIKAGFAVSKKHGSSVKRNKIKRLLRESFRSFLPSIRQNFFFVFIPKAVSDLNFENIYKSMKTLLTKGGFFN